MARSERSAAERAWRQARHDGWHAFCTDAWLSKKRAIYGWIRREPLRQQAEPVDLPPQGTQEDLARLERSWQGLWGGDDSLPAIDPWLEPLASLEAMPPMPRLTAAMLAETVKRTAKAQGGGRGWLDLPAPGLVARCGLRGPRLHPAAG